MSDYVLSVDADLDLDDIWEYIAADNIDVADNWIESPQEEPPVWGHRREAPRSWR